MSKTILVTGSTGFLGRHLVPILIEAYGDSNVIGVNSRDFDLLRRDSTEDMLKTYRPDVVIHLAAYSGGIGANEKYPADFFFKNTQFVSNMFDAAAKFKVNKMIYPMGGCSYPAKANSPISEDQMWNGYPQIESAGYSVAKKIGIVASQSYRSQFDFNSVVLIPGNMYGEFDNFRDGESHVIPAMVRRYYEAKLRGNADIVMWGDGSPLRDFVYAGDVAKAILWFIGNYDSSEPVNISSGTETSIKELAETIKSKMNWNGQIKWDVEKPNGQLIKIFDTKKLNSLGLSCETSLADGLDKTIRWLEKNYVSRGDGIRL